MQLLQSSLIPKLSSTLSFSTNNNDIITSTTTNLSHHRPPPPPSTVIRNGGGPRTFPGGVSKWEWKRMQAKKSKQLLKARLSRERHMYEMRKRAELKAAVANLERPWEVIHKGGASSSSPSSSSIFSVSADEQLKVLADRFQKPGGFDLWSHNDGPQIFRRSEEEDDGNLPCGSARFFPKGVVHSVKPYYCPDPNSISNPSVENSGQRRLDSNSSSNYRGGNRNRKLRGGTEGGVSDSNSNTGKLSSGKGKNHKGKFDQNSNYKDENWKNLRQ